MKASNISVELGSAAMRHPHRPASPARTFRPHDESPVQGMAHLWGDESIYIANVRQRIEILNLAVGAYRAPLDGMAEAGWDTEAAEKEVRNEPS